METIMEPPSEVTRSHEQLLDRNLLQLDISEELGHVTPEDMLELSPKFQKIALDRPELVAGYSSKVKPEKDKIVEEIIRLLKNID